MILENKYFDIIKKIYKIISNRRKKVIFFFLILSFAGAVAEVVSISILIPFVDIIIDPEKIYNYLNKFNIKLNLEKYSEDILLLFVTIFFITGIIISSIIKFLLGYLGHTISNNLNHEFNLKIFKNLIHTETILDQKTDESVLNSAMIKIQSITVLVRQLLSIVCDIVVIFFILILLFNILDIYIIFSLIILGLIYFILSKSFKNILSKNSTNLSEGIENRTNVINNSVGLFKLIKVNSLENFFIGKFIKEDFKIARSLTINAVLSSSPGIIISGLAIAFIASIIYILKTNNYDLFEIIPVFAASIFAVQKILPLMQNIYAANAKFRSNYSQSDSIINFISNKIKINHKKLIKIKEPEKIEYKNIYFSYKNKTIIKNLNLELKKGDRILIKGESGVGKSTLINILLGILLPSKGNIYLKGKTFNNKNFNQLRYFYSYTPQDVFIFKGTYSENISLELDDQNNQRLIEVSKHSQIFDFINKQKLRFNSNTIYSGRNISGGQKQRLGIARGLFKDKLIYIFDESTNAIDKTVENRILQNLKKYYSDKIFIIISHKNIDKRFFNKIYELKNYKLIKIK